MQILPPKPKLKTVSSSGPGGGNLPPNPVKPKPKPKAITPPGPGNLPPMGLTPPGPTNLPPGGGLLRSHGPGSGAPPTAPIDPMQGEYQKGLAHYQRRIADLGDVAADDPRLLEFQKGAAGYQRKLRPSMRSLQGGSITSAAGRPMPSSMKMIKGY